MKMIKNKDFLFSHFLLIRSFNQHFSQKQTILIISWLKFIENRHSICLNPYRGQFNSESPNWLSLLASVFLTVNNAVSDYNTVLNLFFNQYLLGTKLLSLSLLHILLRYEGLSRT